MAIKNNKFWKFRERHGRYKTFEDPEEIWRQACEYFEWCEQNPLITIDFKGNRAKKVKIPKMRPFTMKGLCFYLGIGESTWDNYRKREEFRDVVNDIERIIYVQKFEGAAAGLLNANIISRDLGLQENISANIEKTLQGLSDAELELLASKIISTHKQQS
ncbi:MAG TPA: DNA-packaging protein [Flavisolibacter sp.]|jgi:hypothetical protein|nr:DNA-packaging protein [Flavisolibacter sp.]